MELTAVKGAAPAAVLETKGEEGEAEGCGGGGGGGESALGVLGGPPPPPPPGKIEKSTSVVSLGPLPL